MLFLAVLFFDVAFVDFALVDAFLLGAFLEVFETVALVDLVAFLATVTMMMGITKVDAAQPNYIITTDATYPPFDFQDKNRVRRRSR